MAEQDVEAGQQTGAERRETSARTARGARPGGRAQIGAGDEEFDLGQP